MMHILAPLAVVPEYQGVGVGGELIRHGIEQLKAMGSQTVFVLGHAAYYPRHGFEPCAGDKGYPAPYPIPRRIKPAGCCSRFRLSRWGERARYSAPGR